MKREAISKAYGMIAGTHRHNFISKNDAVYIDHPLSSPHADHGRALPANYRHVPEPASSRAALGCE
jgi:hypothetical protein